MKRITSGRWIGFFGRALAAYFVNADGRSSIFHIAKPNDVTTSAIFSWRSLEREHHRPPGNKNWKGVGVVNLTGKSVNCDTPGEIAKDILESRVIHSGVRRGHRSMVQTSACGLIPAQPPFINIILTPMDEAGEIGVTPEAKDDFA